MNAWSLRATGGARLLCLCTALGMTQVAVYAGSPADEINALIDAVAASSCEFMRNGKSHSAQDAAEHLRMKYRRGKKYAGSAEQFITRLASKSSLSGRPYQMHCGGDARQPTALWLQRRLAALRSAVTVKPD